MTWDLDPTEYPDHRTWLAETVGQIRDDGMATVFVLNNNPVELERRKRVLEQHLGDLIDVTLDVDHLVVEKSER